MFTTVFVGDLNRNVLKRDLELVFKKYGKINSIIIKDRYAFIDYNYHRDALKAVDELNGSEIMGVRIRVEMAKGVLREFRRSSSHRERSHSRRSRGIRSDFRVWVHNVSHRVTCENLKEYMDTAGKVVYIHICKDGDALVEFDSLSDMFNAVHKLDDTKLKHRNIRLSVDCSYRRSTSDDM
ncbi:serine-arginine protein 55-like [Aethina tumida]|uniref:serine-arginine protein 55-like n=1 Tax=Aethina tumida TaxID=116153 RepID=UPI002147C16C|nr:serine-arginine protein 55-like [Aethina tumida]